MTLHNASQEQRAAAIDRLSALLLETQAQIFEENEKDLRKAEETGNPSSKTTYMNLPICFIRYSYFLIVWKLYRLFINQTSVIY